MRLSLKASFLYDNQVPHPKYQCFCAVISVRLRKARANEVPLCFRCAASLRTHPHMYHQRSALSRIHWQLHVKGAVLLSSIHCATMAKISQKILRHDLSKFVSDCDHNITRQKRLPQLPARSPGLPMMDFLLSLIAHSSLVL
jgi:hypothetical protein